MVDQYLISSSETKVGHGSHSAAPAPLLPSAQAVEQATQQWSLTVPSPCVPSSNYHHVFKIIPTKNKLAFQDEFSSTFFGDGTSLLAHASHGCSSCLCPSARAIDMHCHAQLCFLYWPKKYTSAGDYGPTAKQGLAYWMVKVIAKYKLM